MRGPRVQPIVIAAGGTGGHFFPAEALAAALMARGERVVLLTDARSGGLTSPVFANAERHVLAGAGLSGRSAIRAGKGAMALAQGVAQARRILGQLQPAAIVAFGGYPAVPPVLAARMLRPRIKIFLHEQNAVLGRANRFLIRFADTLVLSQPTTTRVPTGADTIRLGNPVRPAVAALSGTGYDAPEAGAPFRILVLGGSLGARIFGTLIPQALALLPAPLRGRIRLVQQCRDAERAEADAVLTQSGIQAELSPFFADVADRLAAAHLVIGRAGASTVAELAAAGRPAILIPLPTAIDDHQRANADALAAVGAVWRLDQKDLTPHVLARKIEMLMNDSNALATAATAAHEAGLPQAADHLADLVQSATVGSGS